ncbi:MAG TPA: hypothetical protein VGS19_02630 [Streptosporangiaceae bacterium]|nr:hypothetical protein [Streptosporangiaceae bacterium]
MAAAGQPPPPRPSAARLHPPASASSVLAGGTTTAAAEAVRTLFASSPVLVAADANSRPALATAAADALRVHAPVLLASQLPRGGAISIASIAQREARALHPLAVLAVGLSTKALSATLRGIRVTASLAKLPATKAPPPLTKVALLVRQGDASAKASAVTATAQAAGVSVVAVRGYDPRADPAAIAALSAARPAQVLALGAAFGPAVQLAGRVAAAEAGEQLPGGGQVLFPQHRIVALYGHPGAPVLGALGEQGLAASIARARRLAARYRSLSNVPVVPAFEIIASVAQGADAPEGGTYSYLTPVADLRPWVDRATHAGLYVILDLQAGRADLLAQAKLYRKLLELPDVGLAIDPEWKLMPHQLPLQQIGSVTSSQVNAVANWLSAVTARDHLPQKLLVLHQFRLSMISDEQGLNTSHDDLAIVIHMDGQGTPAMKQQTWDAVTAAAPAHVYFGWKNFLTKDHPMLTPSQTMARRSPPDMVSYQ